MRIYITPCACEVNIYICKQVSFERALDYLCVIPVQVQDMQPWASITTHLGSHVLKSKDGHPPAPGTLVTAPDVLDCPPEGAMVAA